MTQQDVMQAWRVWMRERGIAEQHIDLLISRGPAWCRYLQEALRGS